MSNVLVVDDEPDIRLLARLMLETAGHQVVEAEHAEAAIAVLAECQVHVVLLDLRMPGMSGWELIGELRHRGLLDRLAVVVFSAHIERDVTHRALAEGARGYLAKPFTAEELLEAVAQAAA